MESYKKSGMPEPVFETSHSFIALRISLKKSSDFFFDSRLTLTDNERKVIREIWKNPTATIEEAAAKGQSDGFSPCLTVLLRENRQQEIQDVESSVNRISAKKDTVYRSMTRAVRGLSVSDYSPY